MKRFQVKESQELEEIYNKLQQDWDAYKKSNTSPKSSSLSTSSPRFRFQDSSEIRVLDIPTSMDIRFRASHLLHNSPTYLMSQLQHSTIEGDDDVEESDNVRHVRRSLSFVSDSSSSCDFSGDQADGVIISTRINGGRGRRKYVVLLGGFVFVALFLFAMYITTFGNSFGGYDGSLVLVPT